MSEVKLESARGTMKTSDRRRVTLSIVANRKFLTAYAFATYSYNRYTLVILSLQYWRKGVKVQLT